MKKVLKFLCRVLEVIVIIYVIFMTTCLLLKNKYGFTEFGNNTLVSVNENNKQYLASTNEGDLLIINKDSKNLKTGDLIYYYAADDDKYVVKNGTISSVSTDDSSALYILDDEDKTSVSSIRTIGKDVDRHEDVGGVLDFLESRLGFLLLVLLPILLVFIYQIYELVIIVKYDEVIDKKSNNKKVEEKVDDVEVL